jgi:hypothetical protein
MQNDDGTQIKNPEKERVIAAIAALKTQGADINPYTVSGEAQVPRSTLYRDPELMDLIHRERNGEPEHANDEVSSKIAELEETNQALNEQIWDLEKQLESATKLKQDAYVQGFQAGIEEAAKRFGAAGGEVQSHAPMPATPESEIAIEEPVAEIHETPVEAQSSYEPTNLGTTDYQFSEIPSNGEGKHHSKVQLGETSGDFEPLSSPYDFGRSPKDSHIAGDFQFNGGSLTAEEPDLSELEVSVHKEAVAPFTSATPVTPTAAVTPAAPVTPTSVVAQKQHPSSTETGEHNILEDIESVLGLSSQAADPNVQAKPSAPDIDFSLAQEQPDSQPHKAKKGGFPDIDFGLSGESEPEKTEQAAPKQHATAAATASARTDTAAIPISRSDTAPIPAMATAQVPVSAGADQTMRDPDAIYNIARSGPTISSSAYNPLVELSWKDLQTVYNFSVASLKDYAKPGFGNENPGPMGGVNFADNSTQERVPSFAVKQELATETSELLEPPDMLPFQDPRRPADRTGDRLQALSDPRNLLDSEATLDLDALDIFDDLDDYVDIDKIEIISDVISEPKKEEETPMGGDELRELIKGRIKQAADIPHEPSAPRTTAAPPTTGAAGDAAKAAAAAGPRNKFVGGAKAGQEPPAVSNFVVKSIPPEIRKACMILGLKPEEATQKSVITAWKNQIASPGVHPDLGGDTEAAVFLNTAKDTLVRWLDAQAPKLGKKYPPKDGKDPKDGPKDHPKDS